jgi:inositol oxygenase
MDMQVKKIANFGSLRNFINLKI